jgi:alkylation response protein AidB-like acyl-CoA dehydrogenase
VPWINSIRDELDGGFVFLLMFSLLSIIRPICENALRRHGFRMEKYGESASPFQPTLIAIHFGQKNMGTIQREKQIADAEELLGDRLKKLGFVRGLFFGKYLADKLPPYPAVVNDAKTTTMAAELAAFCKSDIDPAKIDREERIPDSVIKGLGRIGVLGACLPTSCGGSGLTQTQYCKLLEILGGHCASTALFVNAHHSIGPRALVLFGNEQQQAASLPKLASGEWISAFALTEPEAGSDAANVQTLATPTPDGKGYILNGTKRWITNGGIAQVLTVIARTPVPAAPQGFGKTTNGRMPAETRPTAFIVTPDMPGFQVLEERMPKCGVRGTATGRLGFTNMFVPKENILGQLGKGLKIALTVLDFGRTTFGASCTGAAKFCFKHALQHANSRVQFQQKIGSFELVKEKLAYMAAGIFAMEAVTYQTAALWRIINDTIQIYGGKAYFNDEPFERMMRDGRINMIGEGANDVMRAFVALVGMRDVGLELQGILQALKTPWKNMSRLGSFAGDRIESLFRSPELQVRNMELQPQADRLAKTIAHFGSRIELLLAKYREEIVDHQYQAGRIADAATELYVSTCVVRRLDALLTLHESGSAERTEHFVTGNYYLQTAERRIRRVLADLWDNDDDETTKLADFWLDKQNAH